MFLDAPHHNDVSVKMNRTPGDAPYSLKFEDVKTKALDGCEISMWYIPCDDKDVGKKKVAVVGHQSWSPANKSGMPGNYMPFVPGGPGMLWQNPIDYVKLHKVLHEDGFSVVAYDLRCHGESEKRLPSGWGEIEWMDACGVMDWINQHSLLKDNKVCLMPFCVSGVAFLKANAYHPEKFANVKAWATTNIFTTEKMQVDNFSVMMGMTTAYRWESGLGARFDEYMAEAEAAGDPDGKLASLKADPRIQFTVDNLSAKKFAPYVKVPVLFCDPLDDFMGNHENDAPYIYAAFGNQEESEFHWIGCSAKWAKKEMSNLQTRGYDKDAAVEKLEQFKTETKNRCEGYNFYQSDGGSKLLLEFFAKHC